VSHKYSEENDSGLSELLESAPGECGKAFHAVARVTTPSPTITHPFFSGPFRNRYSIYLLFLLLFSLHYKKHQPRN